MKRINMRTARRAPGQQAPEPVVTETYSVVPEGDDQAYIEELLRVQNENVARGQARETTRSVRQQLRDNMAYGPEGTRSRCLAWIKQWFRRQRDGYLANDARVQSFEGYHPCEGRLFEETQSANWGVSGTTTVDGLLLDFRRPGSAERSTQPHFLGMREVGEDFIFESELAAAVLARHLSSIPVTNPGQILEYYDYAFLQVEREEVDSNDGSLDLKTTFFAKIKGPGTSIHGDNTSLVLVETVLDTWMDVSHVETRVYTLGQFTYVPTLWERTHDWFMELCFGPKGGKQSDIQRTQKVRFTRRPRSTDWICLGKGEPIYLRPRPYPV